MNLPNASIMEPTPHATNKISKTPAQRRKMTAKLFDGPPRMDAHHSQAVAAPPVLKMAVNPCTMMATQIHCGNA